MAEPVTLAEARAQVNIVDPSDTTFDTFLTSLIAPARAYVERCTRFFWVAATREETFGTWGDYLEIYRRPIASVDSITYGPAGDDTDYIGFVAPVGRFPLRIYPAADDSFPTLDDGSTIVVTYTSGALDSTNEEYLIGKRAMLLLIGFWFENRGEIPLDKDTEFAVESLLDDLRPVSAY
jgi:uncharacterized phiE125 gp8 family phage protein